VRNALTEARAQPDARMGQLVQAQRDFAGAFGGEGFEQVWRRWLHDGVMDRRAAAPQPPVPRWDAMAQTPPAAAIAGFEAALVVDQ
jgi:hypothetical protein